MSYKLLFFFFRIGTSILYTMPPCDAGWVDVISLLFVVLEACITAAANPNSGSSKVGDRSGSRTTYGQDSSGRSKVTASVVSVIDKVSHFDPNENDGDDDEEKGEAAT